MMKERENELTGQTDVRRVLYASTLKAYIS
jgi:hypothetical protein